MGFHVECAEANVECRFEHLNDAVSFSDHLYRVFRGQAVGVYLMSEKSWLRWSEGGYWEECDAWGGIGHIDPAERCYVTPREGF